MQLVAIRTNLAGGVTKAVEGLMRTVHQHLSARSPVVTPVSYLDARARLQGLSVSVSSSRDSGKTGSRPAPDPYCWVRHSLTPRPHHAEPDLRSGPLWFVVGLGSGRHTHRMPGMPR